MAFHNTNFTIVPMSTGTYTAGDLGNNLTGSCVHEIYCVSAGTITVTAMGGGTVTVPMTTGQTMKVMVGNAVVASGMFAGFKMSFQNPGIQSTNYN